LLLNKKSTISMCQQLAKLWYTRTPESAPACSVHLHEIRLTSLKWPVSRTAAFITG